MKYLIVLLFFFSESISAKPLFEWGAMGAAATLADYPASDQSRVRALPLPYIIYRGDILISDDEDGTRVRLLSQERFDVDVSFGGSFPTEGSQNHARLGMPELDWTAEFGPRLLYYFFRDPEVAMVRFGIPLRLAFSTDFITTRPLGYTIAPTFQVDLYNTWTPGLNFYFIGNLNYMNEGQADYFYQVNPEFVTAERAAYDAKAGLQGYDLSMTVKYDRGFNFLIFGVRYSDFGASVNRESYLYRKSTDWNYYTAVGWTFFESDTLPFDD